MKFPWCKILGHEWAYKAELEIKPTNEELTNPKDGFWFRSKMECTRCEKTENLIIYGDLE